MAVELHKLPLAKRLAYIERIFIRHASIVLADDTLGILTDVPSGRREATLGYIRGYSRCGKSETLKRHIEKLTGLPVQKKLEQLIGGNGHLVVYVELSSGDTPLGVAQRILGLFEDLKLHRRNTAVPQDRERDAIRRAVDISNDNGVTLLALDEVQNLFRTGSAGDIAKTASMLISMQNASGFPIALTASPRLQELFDGNDAVQERAGPSMFLRPLPFRDGDEQEVFRGLVQKFEEKLPYLKGPGLFSDRWLPATFFATRGRVGRLAKLAHAATTVAFKDAAQGNNPANMTLAHVRRGFELLHGSDPRMLGVNPFDGKALPKIPLSVEEADAITPKTTKKSSRGRSLLDE
ncbi:ATP-binding protein [Methylobacterium sp. J-070]|uniref:ATP-binding protein n=1 Tax=Methylobacterium sp. J-070 TaxID=2836650 RepID=UPI001FB9AE5A|nr:ATP-binding protein [Methylobacterium sp. J-070]MCJ2050530.1 ATP-binding protein [Methylobacterium sp. J-070]